MARPPMKNSNSAVQQVAIAIHEISHGLSQVSNTELLIATEGTIASRITLRFVAYLQALHDHA